MDSKSILVGIVFGILVGGVVGYSSVPAPDYTLYENQIAQFQSQALSLSGEIDDLEYQLMEARATGHLSSFSSYGYMLTLSKENFNIFLQEGHLPSYFLAMS